MEWNQVILEEIFFGYTFKLRLLGLFIVFLTSIIYPVYIRAMVRGDQKPSRSTWFLWGVLDLVTFGAQLTRGIFDPMLFAYSIGTFAVSFFTIKYGTSGWTRAETICSLAVGAIIAIWALTGPFWAMVSGVAGFGIASYPLLAKVWRGGYEDITAWVLVLVSSVFNLLDGQYFVSICFMVLQLSILAPILYYWKCLPNKGK